jgi:hypothetical protein
MTCPKSLDDVIMQVKAATVMRQLQEKGAEFRALQPTGDIRCDPHILFINMCW